MRTRERLIEVLKTVNMRVVGGPAWGGLDAAWKALGGGSKAYTQHLFIPDGYARLIEETALHHASPHIRDLAKEALHYLREDTHV
jgi:hypothetical protein